MSRNYDTDGNVTPLPEPVYDDGRTKQSFKDETDINKILARAHKTGTISHMNRYQGTYSDFSDYDFGENMVKLAEGRQIFDALPSEIRNEFENNPSEFFAYVNDPANKDDLIQKLPALAAPGRQHLDIRGNITADEAKAEAEANQPPPLPDVPVDPRNPNAADPDHPTPAPADPGPPGPP